MWQHTKYHRNQMRNLQENESRNVCFFIHLWFWIKAKVIQTYIKLYHSVTSPCLKQIGWQIFDRKPMLIFVLRSNQNFSVGCSLYQMISVHQINKSQKHTKFYQTQWGLCERMGAKPVLCHTPKTLIKVTLTTIKTWSSVVTIIKSNLNRNLVRYVWTLLTFSFFVVANFPWLLWSNIKMFKLLQHHIKFHPDQLMSEFGENCFQSTLWPSSMFKVTDSDIKW